MGIVVSIFLTAVGHAGRMPRPDGLEFSERIRAARPRRSFCLSMVLGTNFPNCVNLKGHSENVLEKPFLRNSCLRWKKRSIRKRRPQVVGNESSPCSQTGMKLHTLILQKGDRARRGPC
jgi:hypothetical protein